MWLVVVIIVVAIIFLISKDTKDSSSNSNSSSSRQSQYVDITVHTLDIPDNEFSGEFEASIAGVNMHCTSANVGVFHGLIFNEPGNSYNKDAMVIYTNASKKVGYIPESELSAYLSWSKKKPCFCVGFIKEFESDNGTRLFGRITAIQPCNEEFIYRKQDEIYAHYKETEFY